jgi:4-hydroxy-tetrahydrodipicolinate synthase
MRKIGRKVTGMAAVLLPFDQHDRIAEDVYAQMLCDTLDAGLTPAVNMDTGYVNLLTDSEKARVLDIATRTLSGKPFVAGAYIEGRDGEPAELYKRDIALIAEHGGTPILFQTARLHGATPAEIARVYARATAEVPTAYAFELGKMFAPNGEIWGGDVFEAILNIPQIRGMKHSSLDRIREAERLKTRDRLRPDFQIFTGNDLGIDMIEYGSDYLLGLAAFSPAKFAERDRLWEAADPGYLAIADALQLLGNVAFRPPVPAYKHSAAIFLNLIGKNPTDRAHPRSPKRPASEREILQACAERLGLL